MKLLERQNQKLLKTFSFRRNVCKRMAEGEGNVDEVERKFKTRKLKNQKITKGLTG